MLWILMRRLTAKLDRARDCYHAALIGARRDQVSYAVLGQAIQVAEQRPQTSEDLARIENSLRVATHTAIKAANAVAVDKRADKRDGEGMRRSPVLVREIWYDVPPGSGLGGVDVGDLDAELDDLDERLRARDQRDERRDDREDNHERSDARGAHNHQER
jgi:hypothetical protein